MKLQELYQDKQNRDTRYHELMAKGRRLIRRTTGPQQVHPQYIVDYAGPEKYQTGSDNRVYKMYFKQLYCLEEI